MSSAPPPTVPGPGSHLLALVSHREDGHPSYEIRKLAKWMDRIKIQGCREHFAHIAGKVGEAGLVELAIQRAAASEELPSDGKWIDPLAVYDRRGKQADAMRDLLAGRSVFLAGGGPSANELPLEQLERRGAWTMCINNMAGHARFRPQAMVCTDPPEKFTDAVWLDPQIAKFIPVPKLIDPDRGKLRTRLPDGSFAPLMRRKHQMTTQECPNVWAVKRRDWIAIDDTFFTDDAAPNGQYKKGVEKSGERRTICTMIFAMRVLRYLGAREVFLLGVDFHMDPRRPLDGNYSFGEGRTPEVCAANNNQYLVVNDWLCRLQEAGVFERFDIRFYNCNQLSGLRAFPYVPFETALDRVCAGVEAVPRLHGWYSKGGKA